MNSAPKKRNSNLESRRIRATAVRSYCGEFGGTRFNNKLMANALTSSFKYANQELRDAFYAYLNETNQSISGVVNQLLKDFLLEQGIEVVIPTGPVRYGRPLGSRNVVTKADPVTTRSSSTTTKASAAAGYKPIEVINGAISIAPARAAAARRKVLPPAPTLMEISLAIAEAGGNGFYPVGEYHRITPDETLEMHRRVIAEKLNTGILGAVYVDELGNYFDENWEYWFKSMFVSNVNHYPALLVQNAIIDGLWMPSDPEDIRIPPKIKDDLLDEFGNFIENPVIKYPRFNFDDIIQ